jgi:hypothetical protein
MRRRRKKDNELDEKCKAGFRDLGTKEEAV